MARDYDSTVARIAGNILSGYPFWNFNSNATTAGHINSAVEMARAIVAECRRTESAKPTCPPGGDQR